mmetsp:Transcript_36969/g.56634  ORF Transcript_36969/g.56634 Transcript_36969/m.56634 type:complete len:290 (-) Transcript_36969:2350-3219(-)
MSSSSLVAEEVGNRGEGALVRSSVLSSLELELDEVRNELLGLELGEVDAARDLLLVDQLDLHEVGQSCEQGETPWGEVFFDVAVVGCEVVGQLMALVLALAMLEHAVELVEEVAVSRQVGEQTLRDEDSTVVLALCRSFFNDVGNPVDDIWKILSTEGAFLGDNNHVRMGLEGALQGQVGGILAHQTDEVPVLDSGGAVSQHVADQLGVHLRSSIKAQAHLDIIVTHVTIEGGGNHHHVARNLILEEMVGESGAVGEGVSGTNQDEAVDSVLVDASSDHVPVLGVEARV